MFLLRSRVLTLMIVGSLLNACSDTTPRPSDSPFLVNGTSPRTIYTLPNDPKTIRVQIGILSPTLDAMRGQLSAVAATTPNATGELNYAGVIKPFCTSGPYVSPNTCLDLGMSNVPVLDQGAEGTCVTFATTGALDALIGDGNYISQQCSLELDIAYYGPSGNFWNGANYPSQIIVPIKTYGVVQQGYCNATYPNPAARITLAQYKAISSAHKLSLPTSDLNYIYTPNTLPRANMLSIIKTALKSGHRVAIGFGLLDDSDPISVEGFNIKINNQTKVGGLWACMQPGHSTNYCSQIRAGHEVVIIGYDDNQQLFKIRNSWGAGVGDSGDFYMTYTFLEAMDFDSTQIY